MKRATNGYTDDFLLRIISIHALVKRATKMSTKVYHDIMYFNPRPREEGDDWEANFPDMYDISIHALVKRATGSDRYRTQCANISIHALVKRATRA